MAYIKDKFGSKRGFSRYLLARVLGIFGRWDKYSQISFAQVKRLVFICNGNICRSPLAEYVALDCGYASVSYGLNCTRGAKADPRAIKIADDMGIDISKHEARPLMDYKFLEGDLVIGMEPAHLKYLTKAEKTESISLTLLGLWGENPTAYIHDPYNTNSHYFIKCEKEIIARTKSLLLSIQAGQRG